VRIAPDTNPWSSRLSFTNGPKLSLFATAGIDSCPSTTG
jgi:hypothetical protein